MIIRTMPEHDYSSVDDRALDHPGCIVDLGCAGWDWSGYFIGKKRVVGADPLAAQADGAELFRGMVGPFDGIAWFNSHAAASTAMSRPAGDHDDHLIQAEIKSWKCFCASFGIEKVAVLKLNIEGAEYPLLHSLDTADFARIDQIAVSFHDWTEPRWSVLTSAALYLLRVSGYALRRLDSPWGWHLAIREPATG